MTRRTGALCKTPGGESGGTDRERQLHAELRDGQGHPPLLQTQLQSGCHRRSTRGRTPSSTERLSQHGQHRAIPGPIDRRRSSDDRARLVEVTANPRQAYGINWGGCWAARPLHRRFVTAKYTCRTPTFVLDAQGATGDSGSPPLEFIDEQSGVLGLGISSSMGKPVEVSSTPSAGNSHSFRPQMSLTHAPSERRRDAESSPILGWSLQITKRRYQDHSGSTVPQLNFNEQTAQAVFSDSRTRSS
jgi:hypothetical protein